jgi:Domain of unknown function (DUF4190)
MSDTSQGPGWWLASDGKWYPPEQSPGYEPASVPAIAPGVPRTGTLPASGTLPPTPPQSAGPPGPATGSLPPTPAAPSPGVSTGTLPPTAFPPAPPPGTVPPGAYPPGAYAPGAGHPYGGYPPGPGYPYGGRAKTSGLAIASFVLSLVWIFGLGSLLAIIFAIVALVSISRSQGAKRGRGWAVAGLVIGVLGLALVVAASLLVKSVVDVTTYRYGQTVQTDDGITGFTDVTVYSVTTGLHGTDTSGLPASFDAADVQVCVGPAGMPDVGEHLVPFTLKTSGGGHYVPEPGITTQSPSIWPSSNSWPANRCQRGYISFVVPSGAATQAVEYNGNIFHRIQWTASGR